MEDLTHADWWIRTSTKLLQKVDTALRFSVVKVEKTQHLVIENISEATLSKLFFLVNTDQNNNYGYLEMLLVFVKDDYSRTPIPIPGFSTLANAIWNQADAEGFIKGQKTQTAFLTPLNNPYTNEPLSIPDYVDWITAIIPWAPKTLDKEKIFTLVLNPDLGVGMGQLFAPNQDKADSPLLSKLIDKIIPSGDNSTGANIGRSLLTQGGKMGLNSFVFTGGLPGIIAQLFIPGAQSAPKLNAMARNIV
jgi:hypothetical protein